MSIFSFWPLSLQEYPVNKAVKDLFEVNGKDENLSDSVNEERSMAIEV